MSKILTYLDTSVLLAAWRGEQAIADAAMKYLDDPEREFVVTDFLKLELLPKALFHKQVEEAEFFQEFLNAATTIVHISPEMLNDVVNLASQHGLAAIDAIHAFAAIQTSAEFVTKEKKTKPFSNITRDTLKVISINPT